VLVCTLAAILGHGWFDVHTSQVAQAMEMNRWPGFSGPKFVVFWNKDIFKIPALKAIAQKVFQLRINNFRVIAVDFAPVQGPGKKIGELIAQGNIPDLGRGPAPTFLLGLFRVFGVALWGNIIGSAPWFTGFQGENIPVGDLQHSGLRIAF